MNLLRSLLRALSIALLLAICLGIALCVGLILADAGALGTCQDGTCQLVAAIYVMPIAGVILYFAALLGLSHISRKRRSEYSS